MLAKCVRVAVAQPRPPKTISSATGILSFLFFHLSSFFHLHHHRPSPVAIAPRATGADLERWKPPARDCTQAAGQYPQKIVEDTVGHAELHTHRDILSACYNPNFYSDSLVYT